MSILLIFIYILLNSNIFLNYRHIERDKKIQLEVMFSSKILPPKPSQPESF